MSIRGRKSRTDFSKLERELKREFEKTKSHEQKSTETKPIIEVIDVCNCDEVSIPDVDTSYGETDLVISSSKISDFFNYCDAVISAYEYAKQCVEHEQDYCMDILHLIEFSENYKERYRLSTQLHHSRTKRRYYKDRMEELEPLINFLSKDENKRFLDKLKSLCGEIRKIEKNHASRIYHLRCVSGKGVGTDGS